MITVLTLRHYPITNHTIMKKLLLLSSCLLLLFSCSEKNPKELQEEQAAEFFKFRTIIDQVTDNVVSAHENITVRFTNPQTNWNSGQTVPEDVFKISPEVKGKSIFIDNQTISFVPDEPLENNTNYQVKLQVGKLLQVEDDLKEFNFSFKTIKQDFIVNIEPVISVDKNTQRVIGFIRASDILTLEDARKIVTARINSKEQDISFQSDIEKASSFSFIIDNIKRTVDDQELKVFWNGAAIGVNDKDEVSITLPGKDNFLVTDIQLVNSESSYVAVHFSDPLKKTQNLDGLISIEGQKDLKLEIESNTVKVYTLNAISGSKMVEVFNGVESTDGYKLKKPFSSYIAFEQVEPEVKLIKSGAILPSSQNTSVRFKAVNLNAVDVMVYRIYENNVLQFLQSNNIASTGNMRRVGRPIARKVLDLKSSVKNISTWNVFSVDLNELIAPEPGAIYRVELDYKLAYSAYSCNYTAENQPEIEEIDYNDSFETTNWDSYQNYYYDEYDYSYNWRDREDPCTHSFYRNKTVSTNILASDIGVTVKKGQDNSFLVAVTNLLSTSPLAGSLVTFYNYQQQEIATTRTSASGLSQIKLDQVAYFVKVKYKDQYAYVRLDNGQVLPVSKFDTSGEQLQKGIKGYIYTERGVWRPGDHIYLSFVLNDSDNKLPANHPIKLELRDPNGKMIHQEVQKNGLNKVYQFDLQTDETAPTGNWNVQVQVGGISFYKTLKIETIKPNRLKVQLDFEDDLITSGKKVDIDLSAMWLHGAKAKNLKANTTVKYYSTSTKFSKYDNYNFDDPSRYFEMIESEVFDGKLNNDGKASFSINPELNSQAPGMLKANFLTKVYENGGDFSTNVTSSSYSPYTHYVGLKVPPGDKRRGMLVTDKDHTFDVVTVNEKGEAAARQNLEVNVYKVSWRWWWQSTSNSLSRYESMESRQLVNSQKISTNGSGKGSFKMQIKYPEWGRYFVKVYDPESGHSTGKIVYVDWPGWAGKSRKADPETASMLVFNADKESYNVNEQAQITFPSSSGGRALITIENGTEILDAKWVQTNKDKTTTTLTIDSRYVPNVYVHITYLQPHASTANDLPLRMYGVIPLMVENKNTHLQPVIKMPETLQPESKVSITVSEKNNKPMTYTLAVVDEGLLDLTNFKTPNPWDKFFAREALGVKTWDIYDDVIGAYGGRIDAAFAIGGDGTAQAAKAKKANRFEPMVRHIGPFEVAAGKSRTHTIDIPNYVGSVRTMVVASNVKDESYGNAQKTTPVKKPLMMLASLPRKLTPGETVKLPVTVFAMEDNIKNVTVGFKPSNHFEIVGPTQQQLKFEEVGDQLAYFDVKVKDQVGIAQLEFSASSSGEKASYKTEIDIVNPNPFTTSSQQVLLKAGESKTLPIEPFGSKGTNSGKITASTLPEMNIGKRLNYLIRYPHGCVEQTTSAAFPQLGLSTVANLNSQEQSTLSNNVKMAINRLTSFQRPDGGLSYWPGAGSPNDWGTSYAGHFMLEAERAGYAIPVTFKSNWIAYQKQAASRWRYNDHNDFNQAYRLYTLALAGVADLSAMNRFRESGNLSNNSKLRLAAAYAMVGQQKVANELLSNSNIDFKPYQWDYRSYGSPERNRAMALETYVIMGKKEKARELLENIAKQLADNRYMNTQAISYSLVSINKYVESLGGTGFSIELLDKGNKEVIESKKSIVMRDLQVAYNPTTIQVTNTGNVDVFLNTALTGKLPVGKDKVIQSKLSMVVAYTDKNGNPIDVSNLSQGTEVTAIATITNTTGVTIRDVAFSQIVPSGWEMVNTRFTEYGDEENNQVEYKDIRDDRVHYYFDLQPKKSISLKTVINASYLGDYYLPGSQAEAMYDGDYVVRSQGKWITVKR